MDKREDKKNVTTEKTKIPTKFGENEKGFVFSWGTLEIFLDIETPYAPSPLIYINSRHPRSKARYHQID